MEFILFVLGLACASAVLIYFVYDTDPSLALDEEERAFDELVDPDNPTQLTLLSPMVDRIGVLRVHHSEPQRRQDILSLVGVGPEFDPEGEEYHVYVIDTLGAIHDVVSTRDVKQAGRVARKLVEGLNAPLDDPDAVAG